MSEYSKALKQFRKYVKEWGELMSDYIKREDALRKIDSIDDHDDDVRADALGLAAFAVTTVPTADVVEVVRCKDCKWVGMDEHCPAIEVYMICGDNGYCSYGERRDDE